MSLCLYDDKCPVCGKEIYKSTVLKRKAHITVNITLDERPMCGEPDELTNTYLNLTLHLECASKLDWKKVFEDAKKADDMLSGKAKRKESQNG